MHTACIDLFVPRFAVFVPCGSAVLERFPYSVVVARSMSIICFVKVH